MMGKVKRKSYQRSVSSGDEFYSAGSGSEDETNQMESKLVPLSPLACREDGNDTTEAHAPTNPVLMNALVALFATSNVSKTYSSSLLSSLKFLLSTIDSLSDNQFECSHAQMQQDAQEFFNWMRERMIREVPQMKGMFQGKIACETKCTWCEQVSERQEPFLDLQIQIRNHVSLRQCLKNYEKVEFLRGQNKFYCDKCCTLQEATKRDKILQLPAILCIQLKRFQFSEKSFSFQKLMHRVAFSTELRMTTCNDTQDFFYELYAVILHVGHTPHSGHYKSIARTKDGWHMFDDDRIVEFDGDFEQYFGGQGSLETPYMLFYAMSHGPQ